MERNGSICAQNNSIISEKLSKSQIEENKVVSSVSSGNIHYGTSNALFKSNARLHQQSLSQVSTQ